MGASQGEDVPAEDRGVAGLTGRITPAAADGILGVADELNGAPGGRLQAGIARQTVSLADGHRGDRVTVQIGHTRRADEEVAVGALVRGQPFQSAPDRLLMAALDGVNVAGAQKRQEGQPGRGGVRLGSRRLEWARRRPDTGRGNSGSTTRRLAGAARSSPGRRRRTSPSGPSPLRAVAAWRGSGLAVPENGAEMLSANWGSRIIPSIDAPLPLVFESDERRRCRARRHEGARHHRRELEPATRSAADRRA